MSRRADQSSRTREEQKAFRDRGQREHREYRTGDREGRRYERSRQTVGSSRFEGVNRSLLSISGIALLTATKAADAATTAVGLMYVPGVYEANAAVAFLLHRMGVGTGLLVTSFAVVAVIALITEVTAIIVCARRADGHLASVVRVVGYGLPSALFAAVAMYNVTRLLAAIEAVKPF